MLRGDNIICGTSTTGTGTLTLAATPVAPGGIDFDVFARATGIGFGNSAAVLVSYTIIEYVDNTFAKAKASEKGIGTLTLGGSAGIANCTLARTTLQTTATSLNSQPATQNIVPGTGISIGTAANTLVFIGASTNDIISVSPYFDTLGNNLGIPPLCAGSTTGVGSQQIVDSQDFYWPFVWVKPILAKRLSVIVNSAYTGQNTNAYGRIYQVGSNGRPSKLLYDFGLLGTANSSLAATGVISSGAAGSGFFLTPGEYFIDLIASVVGGGAGTPKWQIMAGTGSGGGIQTGVVGTGGPAAPGFYSAGATKASSGTTGAAPDPANVTSYAQSNDLSMLFFVLAAS